jgi:hypothetical protein
VVKIIGISWKTKEKAGEDGVQSTLLKPTSKFSSLEIIS